MARLEDVYPALRKPRAPEGAPTEKSATQKAVESAPVSGILSRLGKVGEASAVAIEGYRLLLKLKDREWRQGVGITTVNEQSFLIAAQAAGIKGDSLANLMATVAIESGFRPVREKMYTTVVSAKRHIAAFRAMSDEDAQKVIDAGPVTFFERAYGHLTEKGKELGNTMAGDGHAFRGGGLIQLTGRDLYARYSRARNKDLVSKPNDITIPSVAIDTSIWYWQEFVESKGAAGDIRAATRVVNPGTPTLDRRVAAAADYASVVG